MIFDEDILMDKDDISNRISKFIKLYLNKWWSVGNVPPPLNNKTDNMNKRQKEAETDKFIDDIVKSIEAYPMEDMRRVWRIKTAGIVDRYIDSSGFISGQDREIIFGKNIIESTIDFANEAKKFNQEINMEDMGQAIRNVWIANIIQMLLDKDLRLTPSIFGYSMLYPFTDNYLDDAKIAKNDKMAVCLALGKRILGEVTEPRNDYEEKLFGLFGNIEAEYDRIKYPDVYESLLCMHKAQIKSMLQYGKGRPPYESDILGISFEKGGISVLTDAYLAGGILDENEEMFFFGFGVLLQLCDDLQDAEDDFKNNHMTIFSQLAYKWPLDAITSKLLNFTLELFDDFDFFKIKNREVLKELISKCCIYLILFAASRNRKLYSKRYFKMIEKYLPFRSKYIKGLPQRLKKRYSSLKKSYSGVKTDKIIEELLIMVQADREL